MVVGTIRKSWEIQFLLYGGFFKMSAQVNQTG